MIEVKQAVANAVGLLRELYGEETVADVRLEEVELSEHDTEWQVTLNFCPPGGNSTCSDLAAALGVATKREYKTVSVSASTG